MADISTGHFGAAMNIGQSRLCVGLWIVAGMACALPAGTLAQPSNDPNTFQDLTPVDPGRADVGPLQVSTRVLQPDLRAPTGFDRVYRLPKSSGALGEDQFFRSSGALTAVFSRSQYLPGAPGNGALIPPGTTFRIGAIPRSAPPRPPASPSDDARVRPAPGAVDFTASARPVTELVDAIDPEARQGPARSSTMFERRPTTIVYQPALGLLGSQPAPGAVTRPSVLPARGMMTDETFRRDRVKELLMAASGSSSPTQQATPTPPAEPAAPTAPPPAPEPPPEKK